MNERIYSTRNYSMVIESLYRKLDNPNFKGSINAIFILSIVIFHTFSTLDFNNKLVALQFYNFAYYYMTMLILFLFITRISVIKINKHHFIFIVFSIYCFLNLCMRKNLDISYAFMFLLWALYIVIIFPLFCRDKKETIELMTKSLVIYLVLFLLLLAAYSYYNNIPLYRIDWNPISNSLRPRFTSGLVNPVYYSKLVSVLIWISLLAYILFRSKFYLLILMLAGIILLITDVRAQIYASIFGIVFYMLNIKKVRKIERILGLISLFIILLGFFLNIMSADYSRIDAFTSGRIDAWSDAVRKTYKDNVTINFLLGSGTNVWGMELSSQERTAHYDNLYLEILLRYGIVGFVLLICAFCDILFSINNRIKYVEERKKRSLIWAKAVIFVILLNGVFDFVIPSLGNPINIVLLPLALNAISWSKFI